MELLYSLRILLNVQPLLPFSLSPIAVASFAGYLILTQLNLAFRWWWYASERDTGWTGKQLPPHEQVECDEMSWRWQWDALEMDSTIDTLYHTFSTNATSVAASGFLYQVSFFHLCFVFCLRFVCNCHKMFFGPPPTCCTACGIRRWGDLPAYTHILDFSQSIISP